LSAKGDLAASAPAAKRVAKIGGLTTTLVTRRELAEMMVFDTRRARAGDLKQPHIVIASNGSVIARYHADPEYRALVEAADIIDPDGMPLVLASKIFLREPLRERVATTDFIVDASAAAAENGIRFYFFGAKPGIADAAADALRKVFPDLIIVGVRNGFFDPEDVPAICEDIVAAKTDVLWLGLGSPMQEQFAVHNAHRLPGVGWIRTCGGLFDHLGAGVPRAPQWMQNLGLEWLFRAVLEPRRLGQRYLRTNPPALYHLLTKTHR
jgi:exopolysaccharide biosynthesis WecB/TagA/CpsF family protein